MPVQNLAGRISLAEGYSKCANSGVSLLANTSTQVIGANADRAYAVFVNNSDAPITLALFKDTGAAQVGQGIVLVTRGSSYEIGLTNLFVGRVVAIADRAASLSIVECTFS